MKMNSLISWVGGKKSIRDLIYARFPQNYGRYIEVFGGGGWVLFGKKPDKFEVYNDFNNNLSNMFGGCKRSAIGFLFRNLVIFLKTEEISLIFIKKL